MSYSVDLRERIVEAVLERHFSIREAAETFRVGHATVERYLRRFRERGELTPCKPSGRPSRVDSERLVALNKQLESPPETISLPALEVPKGHLPPPGECKIWFPDQPAGQQPPAGDCAELSADIPPGAWLLYGSGPGEMVATAYHPEVEGIVVKVETLEVQS